MLKSVVTLATRAIGIDPWETPGLVCAIANMVVQMVGVGGLFMVKWKQMLEKEKLVIGIWIWGNLSVSATCQILIRLKKSWTFQTCIVLRLFYRCE